MNLSPNKLLEEKIINYFKNRKEVITIYLFGSYAVGKELRLEPALATRKGKRYG